MPELIVTRVADIESSDKKPSQILTDGVERAQQFVGEQLRPIAKFASLTVISRFDQSQRFAAGNHSFRFSTKPLQVGMGDKLRARICVNQLANSADTVARNTWKHFPRDA